MSDLNTYRIFVERTVSIQEVAEIEVGAASSDEAIELAKRWYKDGLLETDFVDTDRDVDNVYFSEM